MKYDNQGFLIRNNRFLVQYDQNILSLKLHGDHFPYSLHLWNLQVKDQLNHHDDVLCSYSHDRDVILHDGDEDRGCGIINDVFHE